MTTVSETNLATKCLDFCQTLNSQGLAFKFSLTVGSNFSFTLDTKVLASDTQAKKKKSSPSTIRRNARRREEFLIKKQNPASTLTNCFIRASPGDRSEERWNNAILLTTGW